MTYTSLIIALTTINQLISVSVCFRLEDDYCCFLFRNLQHDRYLKKGCANAALAVIRELGFGSNIWLSKS